MNLTNSKLRIATCSLAGCFGCHMSFLDMDEQLLELVELVEFNRSPLTDIKTLSHCHIGFVEGGLCNQENIEVLLSFREHCDFLVAVGACAINGGVPAMRNSFSPDQCLKEAYIDGMGIVDGQIPDDPELPTLLAKVLPIESQVKIDCHLPGCPPPPAAFLEVVNAFHHNRPVNLDYDLRHFD